MDRGPRVDRGTAEPRTADRAADRGPLEPRSMDRAPPRYKVASTKELIHEDRSIRLLNKIQLLGFHPSIRSSPNY